MAIIGFGFSGLAVLAQLVRAGQRRTITVAGPDLSGLGLAYGTRDPLHLLNVPAIKMGARAGEPEHFAEWLATPAAADAADGLGVAVPRHDEYAPRALYARYLAALRRATLRDAARTGIRIRWVPARATRLSGSGERWTITAGQAMFTADQVVLATGNDPRRVFGTLTHAKLHDGPWELSSAPRGGPAVLIGSGLTAVDTILTLRRLQFRGEILALSRNGLLPKPHHEHVPAIELTGRRLDQMTSLAAIVRVVREIGTEHGWRAGVDALRPHTPMLWQRLSPEDQQRAIARWGAIWSTHRHRMAPGPAGRIGNLLAARDLRVLATQEIDPHVAQGRLTIRYLTRDGDRGEIAPAAVIDCTGPQLDYARSEQPLLRRLAATGTTRPHPTGLGFAASERLELAPHLYGIGGMLTGQRWESIAVPELREQAATVAGAILGGAPAARRARAARS